MTLNELAINALKHGSLSSETGTLSFTWDVQNRPDGTFLVLDWRKRGGLTVKPPTRRGVGTRLMERCIERDLGGDFDLVFNPEGVSCPISCQIAANRT